MALAVEACIVRMLAFADNVPLTRHAYVREKIFEEHNFPKSLVVDEVFDDLRLLMLIGPTLMHCCSLHSWENFHKMNNQALYQELVENLDHNALDLAIDLS